MLHDENLSAFQINISCFKSYIVQVVQPSKPTSPINFTVISCAARTASFTWTAGFTGKALTRLQSFYVLFHEWPDLDQSSAPHLYPAIADTKLLVNGAENEDQTGQLNGLEPDTRYVFALMAYNDNFSESALSKTVTCRTARMH